MLKEYRNILVIRFSSLGDVLLTTPVMESLKVLYPFSKITFLTKEKYAPLFKNNKSVDDIITLDEKKGGILKILNEIWRRRFDLIIDLHKNLRSFFLTSFIYNTEYYGVNKRSLERRILVWFKKNYIPEDYHVVKGYLETIKNIAGVDGLMKPRLYLTEEEISKAEWLLKNKIGHRNIIALAPGAKWNTKRWSEEGFSALANLVHKCSRSAVVMLGDREDQKVISKICSMLNKQAVDLSGELTIRETAAVLKLSKVAVSNDSGLMHLAVAVGTPVIAIFGPTVLQFGFGPLGEKDTVIQTELPCRPCSLHGGNYCPEGHHRCMKDIKVEMVWEKLLPYVK